MIMKATVMPRTKGWSESRMLSFPWAKARAWSSSSSNRGVCFGSNVWNGAIWRRSDSWGTNVLWSVLTRGF